jgi:hypothetical protein
MADDAALTTRRLTRRSIWMFIGLTGVVIGLTCLFFGMRAVMEVGGSCGTGTAAQPSSQPCPEGVPGLMIGGIFGGLICLAIYAFHAFPVNLTALAWPALFLSLGWNFFDYGINAPDGSGASVGWLICAVIFGLMGGVPLALGIAAVVQGKEEKLRTMDRARLRGIGAKTTTWLKPPSRAKRDGETIEDELKRLDDLRVSGQLTKAEYEAARTAALKERES